MEVAGTGDFGIEFAAVDQGGAGGETGRQLEPRNIYSCEQITKIVMLPHECKD